MKHEAIITEKLRQFSRDKLIESKLAKKLEPSESRTPEFYLLPKIHKRNTPGRPVISSSGCHTEKISAYVDQHLQPAAKALPSYLCDTDDFIGKIRKIGKVSPDDILVSLDVSSLYTNICNEEGVESIRKNKTLKETLAMPFINMLCTIMQMILTMNNFIFNGSHYHQVRGTAMGTRAAPNYANIFMGQFEEAKIYKSNWMKHIRFYGRFIDDICIIWKGSVQQLENFITHLNNTHASIKFTAEYSKSKIDFLDVTVIKDAKGYLSTDVYQKPTNTHNYLNRDSAHPEHCKKGIPHSQFLRLKRIISDPARLKLRIKEYTEYFANSGYSRSKLEKTGREILSNNNKPTSKKRDTPTDAAYFITPFNPAMPNLNTIIHKHWSIVQTNEKCRDSLKSIPKIVYKRSQNLADILVRAKFRSGATNTPFKEIKKVTRCNKCSWCKHITEGSAFASHTTKKRYKIYHEMGCTSSWVIYLCRCKVHKCQYVGKSTTKLNIRMNNNRNHIRIQDRSCKLVQHFLDSDNCSFAQDMELMPIEQITMENSTSAQSKNDILKKREIFWQNLLKTFTPEGMNKREG